MIRRQTGNDYLLITQDEHARLAGRLAAHFGNERFSRPEPAEAVVRAVAMHDAGWPLIDDHPPLDPAGHPLHVFDAPLGLAARAWTESVRRAAESGAYTGLLVSLHVFALSAIAYQHHADVSQRSHTAKEIFEVNKFQQTQIETQEALRRQLGLRTDAALSLGLASRGSGAEEDNLRFNYQILRAMDQLSLGLLCGGRPFSTIEDVSASPGEEPITWRVGYSREWRLTVNPWPFESERIEDSVALRRTPARVYADERQFHDAYLAAPVERMTVVLESRETA